MNFKDRKLKMGPLFASIYGFEEHEDAWVRFLTSAVPFFDLSGSTVEGCRAWSAADLGLLGLACMFEEERRK